MGIFSKQYALIANYNLNRSQCSGGYLKGLFYEGDAEKRHKQRERKREMVEYCSHSASWKSRIHLTEVSVYNSMLQLRVWLVVAYSKFTPEIGENRM